MTRECYTPSGCSVSVCRAPIAQNIALSNSAFGCGGLLLYRVSAAVTVSGQPG